MIGLTGEGVNQQKKGGDVKNRVALGDIGNRVAVRGAVEGKQKQPQINHRPITRSFCAQLLANAQAAAAADNKVQRLSFFLVFGFKIQWFVLGSVDFKFISLGVALDL